MRITENGTIMANVFHLVRNGTALDKLQLELASGRRLNKDSDDPMDSSEVHVIRRQAAYLGMYGKNIDRAIATLNYTDTILSNINQMLYQVQQISSQAASGLLSADQRKTSAETILQIRDGMVALANTSYQGVYLFSGAQSNTKPYTYIDPDNPTETDPDPNTSYVIFQGDTNARQVPVSNQVEIQDTVTGVEAFHTDVYPTDPLPSPPTAPSNSLDVFEVLRQMADAISQGNFQNGEPNFDQLAPRLEEARNTVSDRRSKIGAQLNIIQKIQQDLTDQTDQLTIRASKLEDADIAKVVTDLTMRQTAQQASLYAQGSVMKSTLFDYIG